jgi:hypothetical protein
MEVIEGMILDMVNQLGFQELLDDDTAPSSITLPDGTIHGLDWHFDPDVEEPYVSIGWNLPNDSYWFAEIEDDTYGQLQALRLYYNALR